MVVHVKSKPISSSMYGYTTIGPFPVQTRFQQGWKVSGPKTGLTKPPEMDIRAFQDLGRPVVFHTLCWIQTGEFLSPLILPQGWQASASSTMRMRSARIR